MTTRTDRRHPNLFLIGAQKAGTTLLYDAIATHDHIAGGVVKEPGYFAINHHLGEDWYLDNYRDVGDEPWVIDGSTTYSLARSFPDAAPEIAAREPEARFVYLLRHPLERIESSWMQFRAQGLKVSPDFSRALRTYPLILEGSRYWTNASAFLRVAGADRLKIMFFEDLKTDSGAVIEDTLRFLDLDPSSYRAPVSDSSINASIGKTEPRPLLDLAHRVPGYRAVANRLPESTKRRAFRVLRQEMDSRPEWTEPDLTWASAALEQEVRAIAEYTGRDLTRWLEPPSRRSDG